MIKEYYSTDARQIRHIEEELNRLRLPLVLPLCRKCPPVSQLWPILPLDQQGAAFFCRSWGWNDTRCRTATASGDRS